MQKNACKSRIDSGVARQCAGLAGQNCQPLFFQVNLTDVDVYKDTVGNLFIEF